MSPEGDIYDLSFGRLRFNWNITSSFSELNPEVEKSSKDFQNAVAEHKKNTNCTNYRLCGTPGRKAIFQSGYIYSPKAGRVTVAVTIAEWAWKIGLATQENRQHYRVGTAKYLEGRQREAFGKPMRKQRYMVVERVIWKS